MYLKQYLNQWNDFPFLVSLNVWHYWPPCQSVFIWEGLNGSQGIHPEGFLKEEDFVKARTWESWCDFWPREKMYRKIKMWEETKKFTKAGRPSVRGWRTVQRGKRQIWKDLGTMQGSLILHYRQKKSHENVSGRGVTQWVSDIRKPTRSLWGIGLDRSKNGARED